MRSWKEGLIGIILSILLLVSLSIPMKSQAENYVKVEVGQRAKQLSKNGEVHKKMYEKMKKNMDKYVYTTGFKLTKYTPRDAGDAGDEDRGGDKSPLKGDTSGFRVTYFYKEKGKWVLSTLSHERTAKMQKKFGKKVNTTKQILKYNGENYIKFKNYFEQDLTKDERTKLLANRCSANIQFSGVPFIGKAEKPIEWGAVAGDINKQSMVKLHQELYVEGYGYAKVLDIGGAIRGKHLDLFYDDCDDVFATGTLNNKIVIWEKGKAQPNLEKEGKPLTEEILNKVNNSKKWGENNAEYKEEGGANAGSSQTKTSDKSNYEFFNPFKSSKVGGNVTIDTGRSEVPQEAGYTIAVASNYVYKIAVYTTLLFSAIMIVLLGLQIASIAFMMKNGHTGMFRKVERIVMVNGLTMDNYKSVLLQNTLIVLLLTAVLVGGFTSHIQYLIYRGVQYVMTMLGWY